MGARAEKAKLDKSRVASTALDLLNDVGLEGLTLRAIAKELNIQAPALYWHFKNKQALLDEMATEMYRRMTVDIVYAPAAGWQDHLREANHGLRDSLLRYRDGAKVFSGSQFTGSGHGEGMETELDYLLRAGFSLRQAVRASTTAYLFTLGFVTEEQGVRPVPGKPGQGVDLAQRSENLREYPLAAAAGEELFASYDERFDEGLDIVILGIETRYGIH
ncbi:TetR/AcrR family transcriptional regulator C-terminal domain-containing protein [Streptomyces sp. NA04227]|uniref:TetR/AcrR family transcriptional regulator C-terminal domain-containing protein n=1 Tax=Streptomyces sp. NA04227 TaxID=2742136 RepID=UPI001590FA48|nr:TetR/AcrR family transcriptional regulator C-terminal domain-containing protein [Streptomyces sp. NA04227]QKW11099.1 TetR/AcrR family transcriptional regulator C-terminal domain-containing protein [Streptomyces sp. NA04227]